MLYTKEWIQAIVRETLKEIPVCRTGTSEGSKVSFHTAHADVVPFRPLEGGNRFRLRLRSRRRSRDRDIRYGHYQPFAGIE